MDAKGVKNFFVYGTLKEGGYFAKNFDKLRISSKKAEVTGFKLYDLGSYPGMIPGKEKVFGEIHEYSNFEDTLRRMDRIEGYTEERDNNLYRREVVSVTTEDGKEVDAIAYVFDRGLPHGAQEIESGSWPVESEGE